MIHIFNGIGGFEKFPLVSCLRLVWLPREEKDCKVNCFDFAAFGYQGSCAQSNLKLSHCAKM